MNSSVHCGSGDPFPLALSVFDLDVFAFYFKDPFEFLYYLRQRVALNDHFKANSEMSVLGFHLKHKLFKEENVSMVALDDSFAQLIDANFPALRGSVPKTTAADKLYPKWKNEEFQQLVDQIKSTGISGFTDAIFFLYDLAGKGADQLVTFLKSIKLKAALDGRSHDARLLYSELNAGITIVSEPRSPEALQTKLLPLAEMSKYRSKADVWLALGCMATSPRLVDAMGFTKEPWKEDLSLRDLIAKLPFGGTAINHSGTKIGRNDQCPCGSGQKFKRCHGK
jgi:hypothetical protein